MYCPSGFTDTENGAGNVVDGNWRNEVGSKGLNRAGHLGSDMFSRSAAAVRECFLNYFMSSKEEIQWQYHHIHRTGY